MGFQNRNQHGLVHGHNRVGKRSATYSTWGGMKQRCTNRKSEKYLYYGGRGIKVCERWQVFENFLEDMGERPKGLTLERIDNNASYCQENCRWATRKEQAANRSHNNEGELCGSSKLTWKIVKTIRGLTKRKCPVTQTRLAEWFGVKQATISDILRGATWQES